MSNEFLFYISHYGYLAVFIFVFLQDVGFPIPIPNEFVLIFCGSIAFTGTLHLLLIILCAISGDLLAASVLYFVFYLFGSFIMHNNSRWVPISQHTIINLAKKIEQYGITAVVISRLLPFIRGYVAVICGILHFKPQQYGFIIFTTAVLWSSFYIVAGYYLGPYLNHIFEHMDQFKYVVYGVVAIAVITLVIRIRIVINKRQLSKNNKPIIK